MMNQQPHSKMSIWDARAMDSINRVDGVLRMVGHGERRNTSAKGLASSSIPAFPAELFAPDFHEPSRSTKKLSMRRGQHEIIQERCPPPLPDCEVAFHFDQSECAFLELSGKNNNKKRRHNQVTQYSLMTEDDQAALSRRKLDIDFLPATACGQSTFAQSICSGRARAA